MNRGRSKSRSNEAITHRGHGALQAKNQIWEDIANKSLPPEASQSIIKALEKQGNNGFQRTYTGGVAMQELQESAPVLRVGLVFLPGADKPQVARTEEKKMAGGEPDQKDATWRVNTAGSLLMRLDVSEDLSIVTNDQTSEIAKRARLRKERRNTHFPGPRPALLKKDKSLELFSPKNASVTIDSQCVRIVNDLRPGHWDLEATLIEVDGGALLSLIVNYRHLISQGGPDMSFEATRQLLEIMIEDARRLCVRSPVLFRMSTRDRIINSKNTRYGINHGPMFRTLTTSKGIREIISISASYYNSLDPIGSKNKTQKSIRPRFLQMMVLLLSLLNNEDLLEITDFLESTYKLKADRWHLELLFLKVIPLMSINSKVFLEAMVPAFEGFPLENSNLEDNYGHYWNTFVLRVLQQGYLLPGTVTDLGRDQMSWIIKWPEDGFHSSTIFNNLQYFGSRSRTINDIPPIELHPEAQLNEVTVIMTDGKKYTLSSADIDPVTYLTLGRYSVLEAHHGGRHLHLEVQEIPLNLDLYEAVRFINTIIAKLNAWIAAPSTSSLWHRGGRKFSDQKFFEDFKASGRLTKNVALLNQNTLAIAYKVEGRKISMSDTLRNMSQDIRDLKQLIVYIENRMFGLNYKPSVTEKLELQQALEQVKERILVAEDNQRRIGEYDAISDEPIGKVLYPGGIEVEDHVWQDFHALFKQHEQGPGGSLQVQARQSSVSGFVWLADDMIEVSLVDHPTKYFVTPLQTVVEAFRNDEIQVGDIALLAGEFMILAVPGENRDPDPRLVMTNYLKVTSVEEQGRTRRGMNRRQNPTDERVVCLFR